MPKKNVKKQGVNKAFIDNQWKKGQSGNPKGRMENQFSITYAVKTLLKDDAEGTKAIARRVIKDAKAGDRHARDKVWAYMDGMPLQGIEHTGKDGAPISIITKVPKIKDE